MTLQELAYKEDSLYSKTIELNNQAQSTELNKQLNGIFIEYKKVHQKYADLSFHEIEALKRALFIQWYALTEPSHLTGISDLDDNAEHEVIQNLNAIIKADNIDSELIWMLNYYSNWEWVFEKHKTFYGFDVKIVNKPNNQLPDKIDRERMKLRGQMGKYWNSLTIFSKD